MLEINIAIDVKYDCYYVVQHKRHTRIHRNFQLNSYFWNNDIIDNAFIDAILNEKIWIFLEQISGKVSTLLYPISLRI
jgi:hypothetical protein